MVAQDQSKAVVDAFAEQVLAASKIRRDDEWCERVGEAIEGLNTAPQVDIRYLEHTLRARPMVFRELLDIAGPTIDFFIEETLGDAPAGDVFEWFDECYEGIQSHFDAISTDHGGPPIIPDCAVLLRPASPAPGRGAAAVVANFYFLYDRVPEGRVLWDRRVFDLEFPMLSFLAASEEVDEITYDPTPLPRWTPGPLFRYHPERYQQTRAYVPRILNQRRGRAPATSREIWEKQWNGEMRIMLTAMNEQRMCSPMKEGWRPGHQSTAAMYTEANIFVLFDQFHCNGRQVFDIPPMIVEMFRNTDVDDVPLNLLHSPYESYYIHFGPQEGLEIEPGWSVDGAYVTHIEKHELLQIVLVGRPTDDGSVRNWFKDAEPIYTAVYDKSVATMDVGTATDTVVAKKLAELDREVAVGNAEMQAKVEEARLAMRAQGQDISNLKIIPSVSENGTERAQTLQRRTPVFKEALRLVINGICYLTAYPDDSDPQWPADAPSALVQKATEVDEQSSSGRGKANKKAKSQLEALGYRAVHLCGQHFRKSETGEFESTDRTVKRHWRRGFWTRQAYGERWSLRRLAWRHPVIVRRDVGADDDTPGHIYLVS